MRTKQTRSIRHGHISQNRGIELRSGSPDQAAYVSSRSTQHTVIFENGKFDNSLLYKVGLRWTLKASIPEIRVDECRNNAEGYKTRSLNVGELRILTARRIGAVKALIRNASSIAPAMVTLPITIAVWLRLCFGEVEL